MSGCRLYPASNSNCDAAPSHSDGDDGDGGDDDWPMAINAAVVVHTD